VTYRGLARLVLSANAAASVNRIREYRDDQTGDAGVVYRNVEPLLTPRFVSGQRVEFAASRGLRVAVEIRYQSRAYLQNTSDARFVLPALATLDGSVSWHIGRQELLLRANNLTDSKKYGSGYAGAGVSYYYVLPPRNLFLTAKLTF